MDSMFSIMVGIDAAMARSACWISYAVGDVGTSVYSERTSVV